MTESPDFDSPDADGPVFEVPDGSEWMPVPDALDLVLEAATMESVFVAHRLIRVDAMRRETLAEAQGRGAGVTELLERSLRLDLAAALRVTEYAAGKMIAHAEALVHRYPDALDSLAGGRITPKHAEIYVDAVEQLPPQLRGEVTTVALELAETQPVGTFRRALNALAEKVQARTLEERHRAALQNRRLFFERGHAGMGELFAFAPEVELHAIFGRITAIAKTIHARDGETRTLDQIRADVLCDLLIDGTTDHLPAAASGIRAEVVVTVPVLSLLQGEDTDGAAHVDDTAGGIADLPVVEGLGPIPMSKARELAGGDTTWMRVLTHPETGVVLSVGRDRYQAPASLRRLVRWRSGRCMGPGCGMPASRCEIDHQIRWVDGGETSLENNTPFCKNHHLIKDNTDWEVRQLPGSGGAIEWNSPTGRRYVVHPERRVPVFTVSPPREDEPAPPF